MLENAQTKSLDGLPLTFRQAEYEGGFICSREHRNLQMFGISVREKATVLHDLNSDRRIEVLT